MTAVAISTKDNPFDPFDKFDEWLNFDLTKGYNSCGLLARIAMYSDSMTNEEIEEETERAIDKIIELDLTKNWIKVKRELKPASET